VRRSDDRKEPYKVARSINSRQVGLGMLLLVGMGRPETQIKGRADITTVRRSVQQASLETDGSKDHASLVRGDVVRLPVDTTIFKNTIGEPTRSIDVRAFGVVGDGQVAIDCSMAAGSAILTCTGDHFRNSDMGKVIAAYAVGPTINTFVQPLATTILSYRNPKQVVLNAKALATVLTSERVVWGTDDTGVIQAAVDAGAAKSNLQSGTTTIYFPPGIYLTNVIDLPCSRIGRFSAGTCTKHYNNLWLRGSGRDTTTIENWNPAYDYKGTGHTYQGGSGVVVYGGKGAIPGTDGSNIRLKLLTISDMTIRQVKNPTQAAAKVVFGATSESANIYNTRMVGYSYECLVLGGLENSWYDSVHDNVFTSCGNTGPAQATSVAAINVNGSHTQVYNNRVTGSPQGTETGGRNQEFWNNFFDGAGTTVTPSTCINLGSTGAGVWGDVFRQNICKNFDEAVAMGNGSGTLDRIQFVENTFSDSGSAQLAGGADSNSITNGMSESDSVIHGTSTFKGNRFIATKTHASKSYGIQVGYGRGASHLAQESWNIDDNTIQMPDMATDGIGIAIHLAWYSFSGWQPATAYATTFAASSYVQPTVPNGFYYKATKAGRSGISEPNWCPTANCTVEDGELTWKMAGAKPKVKITNNSVHIRAGAVSQHSDIILDGTLRDDISFVNNTFDYNWRQYSRTPVIGYVVSSTNPDELPAANFPYGDQDRQSDSLPVAGYYRSGDHIWRKMCVRGNADWVVTRSGHAAPRWAGTMAYSFNSWVTVVPDNGHFYRQTTIGGCTSGIARPTFPLHGGAAVVDNTCAWKESGASVQFSPMERTVAKTCKAGSE
jgi:hypothetical protein